MSIFSRPVHTASHDKDLKTLLPPPGWSDQWKRYFNTQEYKGDDLFLYINGGAELYHEYGFKQVLVQDFQNPEGKSISLEIYEMTHPDSAFGIYTFKRSQEGKLLEIGDEATLDGYYMNFWKGNFLITLTGFDEDKKTIAGLSALAFEVEKRILSPRRRPPQIIHALPPEGLIKSSIKYLRGNLALFNCYPFSAQGIFKITDGVRGSYTEDYEIYIFAYETETESMIRFKAAAKHFQNNSKFRILAFDEKSLHMRDSGNQSIHMSPVHNCILILLGNIIPGKADEINRILQSRIRKYPIHP